MVRRGENLPLGDLVADLDEQLRERTVLVEAQADLAGGHHLARGAGRDGEAAAPGDGGLQGGGGRREAAAFSWLRR